MYNEDYLRSNKLGLNLVHKSKYDQLPVGEYAYMLRNLNKPVLKSVGQVLKSWMVGRAADMDMVGGGSCSAPLI